MKRLLISLSFIIFHLSMSHVSAQQVISLEGAWDFRMGDTDAKTVPEDYDDYVMLPGSMLTNGKGNPVSVHTQWTGSLYDSSFYFNPYMEKYRREGGAEGEPGEVKFPFFLTPERHYVGAAWYHRSVYVPKSWSDQRITLFLERPHIETKVYVNGRGIGRQLSLSTPHRYDITSFVNFGDKNDISIRVYNGIENVCVGQDSHSVTDQTQGNWNGIVGRIELQAQWKKLNIRHVRVVPNAARRKVDVEVELENHVDGVRFFPDGNYHVYVTVRSVGGWQSRPIQAAAVKEAFGSKKRFEISLGEKARLWDEFEPNLYLLTVRAGDDVYETTFGLRDISVEGRQLKLNGHPLFLRGTVENCCFPATGFPPTDEQEWLRIFRKCKEYGLNHVRFHSYCPPEAAFAAADQLGIYIQAEGPTWPNHGVKLRRGMKIDQYLLEESKRIIDEYGHHPSFVMMAAGNEPAGDWVSYCNDWVKEMKKYAPTKLYAGASVGGGWAWDSGSEYHVKGGARGLDDWNRRAPSSDDDYYSGILHPRNYKGEEPNQTPIVTHEKGQWCAFPDFSEIPQYTGVYKAGNFEIFRDLLRDNGMEGMGSKFLHASGKLQMLCYKYEIERNLRTKDYAGFQLLGLNDYSGQGTALVGVLNVFWREKGYCTAREWRESCGPIVPLARFPKFVFTNDEQLQVPVELYNAFKTAVSNVNATYSISDDQQRLLAQGTLFSGIVPVGKNFQLGTVKLALDTIRQPAKLTLAVQLSGRIQNHWEFWVYPGTADRSPLKDGAIYIADTLDAKALKTLKKGGTVLLTAAGRVTLGSDVKQTYLPVFWNTSWFKMRPPHTTGAYIHKDHPLFRHGFPTDDWSNLNWWELLNKAQVMNLMELPANYQSPIQPIDTWHVSRKLGMLVEARVGKGRLLMTTMDITRNLDHRPVARQMRKAILSYMQSNDFQPALELSVEQIQHFYTEQAPAVNMFTNDSPDELKPKIK
ncbi:MAG: beta-glucuronidase [Prevotella sp.]|nr:beta-glucuronidase [Prevotella sp.]